MTTKMRLSHLSFHLLLAIAGGNLIAGEGHDHERERREHGAHVHGIAALNVVLEGTEVHIELDSPATNIMGFEHTPSSEEDLAALNKAVGVLKDGDRLFRLNDAAHCRMETAKVASELLDEEQESLAEEETGGQAHEAESETHSDIEATYHFECNAPGNLTQLKVDLFKAFPAMEELMVQYVIESKQGAAELTATDHAVKF